jgi:acyl-coenzyme A synthetase/AMP-(fatty) acid ligase
MHDTTLTEMVASLLAVMAVGAIIWLAIAENSPAAQTGLVGLTGAASSFYLTSRLPNGKKASDPPAAP